MSLKLAGKTALVTGGARGIGLAIARRYAGEGAAVAIIDVDAKGAVRAAEQLNQDGLVALGLGANVGFADEVDRAFDIATRELGPVDILVNNAANTGDQRHFFLGDEKWWDDHLRTNLKSQYLCLDRASRQMARRGGGAVVNMSSGGATRAHRGMVAYDASKGGVEALTRSAAIELAPYGIRVNALVPGLIATTPDEPLWSLALRDATVPMQRGGTADDLTGAALFLVTEDSAYVTGITLVVDGGVLVQQRSPQVDTLALSAYPDLSEL